MVGALLGLIRGAQYMVLLIGAHQVVLGSHRLAIMVSLRSCSTAARISRKHEDSKRSMSLCSLSVATRPPCIRALYDIPIAHLADDVNAVGFYESADYWDQQDLNLFFANYAPEIPQGTAPTVYSIDGGIPFHQTCAANGNSCGESTIDIVLGYSLVWPQTVVVYQVEDKHRSAAELAGKIDGYLNNFLDAVSVTPIFASARLNCIPAGRIVLQLYSLRYHRQQSGHRRKVSGP